MRTSYLTLLLLFTVSLASAITNDTIYNVDKYGCVSNESGVFAGTLSTELAFPFSSASYSECMFKLKADRLTDTTKDSVMWGVIVDDVTHYIWVPVSDVDDTTYTTYTIPVQGVLEVFFDAEIGEASYHFSYSPQSASGINDVNERSQLIVYPNPAGTYVNVQGVDVVTVELYDLTGRLVMSQNRDAGIVDISGLTSGIYTIVVACVDEEVFMEKLVIE